MPKNNKKAVGRTLLFVFLTAAVLAWGGRQRVPMLEGEGLSGFVKEVISWVAALS